jgi:hypothetical protein
LQIHGFPSVVTSARYCPFRSWLGKYKNHICGFCTSRKGGFSQAIEDNLNHFQKTCYTAFIFDEKTRTLFALWHLDRSNFRCCKHANWHIWKYKIWSTTLTGILAGNFTRIPWASVCLSPIRQLGGSRRLNWNKFWLTVSLAELRTQVQNVRLLTESFS